MSDFHIPTPEESDNERNPKRRGFRRFFGGPKLNVPEEVGQQKKVEPAPPTRPTDSVAEPRVEGRSDIERPPDPPPPDLGASIAAEPASELGPQGDSSPPAQSRSSVPLRGVRIDPDLLAARGTLAPIVEPTTPAAGLPTEQRASVSSTERVVPLEPEQIAMSQSIETVPEEKRPRVLQPDEIATGRSVHSSGTSYVDKRSHASIDEPPDTQQVDEVERVTSPDSHGWLIDAVNELREEIAHLRARVDQVEAPNQSSTSPVDPDGDPLQPESPAPVATRALMQVEVDIDQLLALPPPSPPSDLAPSVRQRGELWHMTNRLNPLKVSVRVLANMRKSGQEWPTLTDFQSTAAWAARHLGQRLKKDDEQRRASRSARRAIAYPTGPKVEQSLQRFVSSFTLDTYSEHGGPLQLLNLARIQGDRAVLTAAGWALSSQPGPLLDGEEGHLLNEAEQGILRRQLQEAPGEGASVAQFLRLVQEVRGIQTMLDEYLDDTLPEWVTDIAVWRTGMLGRLRDAGLVEVDGEGKNARIRLTDAARAFMRNFPE
jgi:hypothetical protein